MKVTEKYIKLCIIIIHNYYNYNSEPSQKEKKNPKIFSNNIKKEFPFKNVVDLNNITLLISVSFSSIYIYSIPAKLSTA